MAQCALSSCAVDLRSRPPSEPSPPHSARQLMMERRAMGRAAESCLSRARPSSLSCVGGEKSTDAKVG
eukprot:scaffold190503_cov26-Tisochrysis_lutea.AAC.8